MNKGDIHQWHLSKSNQLDRQIDRRGELGQVTQFARELALRDGKVDLSQPRRSEQIHPLGPRKNKGDGGQIAI